jgi:hypothetical protein
MPPNPVGDVPAAGDDPKPLAPRVADRGLDQPTGDTLSAIGGGDVGVLELEHSGAGRCVREYRRAGGDAGGETLGFAVVFDGHGGEPSSV